MFNHYLVQSKNFKKYLEIFGGFKCINLSPTRSTPRHPNKTNFWNVKSKFANNLIMIQTCIT